MARVFPHGGGKALSVTSLGHPLGEGLLPLLVVLMIHASGWRVSWMILGLSILLVFVPATQSLLRRNSTLGVTTGGGAEGSLRSLTLFRDPSFLLVLAMAWIGSRRVRGKRRGGDVPVRPAG